MSYRKNGMSGKRNGWSEPGGAGAKGTGDRFPGGGVNRASWGEDGSVGKKELGVLTTAGRRCCCAELAAEGRRAAVAIVFVVGLAGWRLPAGRRGLSGVTASVG